MMVKKFFLYGVLAVLFFSSACQARQSTSDSSPAPAQHTPTQTAETNVRVTPTPQASPTAQDVVSVDAPDATQTQAQQSEAAATPTRSPDTTDPTSAPETPAVVASPPAAPGPKTCQDVAAFYGDITIPDGTLFRPGEQFTKIWRVRNNGDCTWEAGYALVFAGGELMAGPLRQALDDTAPGETLDISIDLTAPPSGGQYLGNWWFEDQQGNVFGTGASGKGTLWALINVTYVESATGGGFASSAPGAVTGGTPANSTCGASQNPAYISQLLSLINEARQANGLNALVLDEQLNAAAAAHSNDMACNSLLTHIGSDGSNWYARVARAGFANSASARENIYAGDPNYGGDPQGAFNWWMNSQIHRDNILMSDVSVAGIGYAYSATSQYGGYYTVVFARP